VRFLYGLPFAGLWLFSVHLHTGDQALRWRGAFIASRSGSRIRRPR
jgi:hypothetical protein